MENKTKAETFIGFSIRARKCRIGTNAVATLKKAELIIVCHTASDNTVKEAESLARRFKCKIIKTVTKPLSSLVVRENAKVMALTDKALATALLTNIANDFIELD